jgi:uncharacterized protein YkwD
LSGREAARGHRLTFNQREIMSLDRSSRQKLATYALAMAVLSGGRWIDERVDPAVASLLAAHNRERKKEGRDPLRLSSKLCQAAAVHALDMAKHQKLDHAGSDGSTVADRIKRTGYVFVRVGENIAVGQETVDEVMTTWMKSPGHRANILAEFTEMGAARAEDEEGEPYWCVNFGIPMPRLKAEEAAAAVIKQINRDRQAAGRVELKVESRLARAAMAISEAMAAKDSLDLDSDPFKLIDEKAIEGREVRLQLSANVATPVEAANALLGEDANQLASFREIGVGYALAKNGTPYWCAIFAKPSASRGPGFPKKDGAR